MRIEFMLTLRTKSPNVAENGWTRSTRRKAERHATWAAWMAQRLETLADNERATITLTRIGPRPLDTDNLYGSCKTIVDTLSALLILGRMPERGRMGHYDSDPRLSFRYAQEKGKYAVRVSIEVETAVAMRSEGMEAGR